MRLRHAETTAKNIVNQAETDEIARYINDHIEQHPHRATPEEARTIVAAVPVWAIIGHLEAVKGDINQVAEDYELEPEVVVAATAYYHQHRDAITARIAANADIPAPLAV